MGVTGSRPPGNTLGFRLKFEGSADLSDGLSAYTVRRAVLAGLAIAAFVAGVAATSAVIEAQVDPGVIVNADATQLQAVTPAGPAWRLGMRAGQSIVALRAADEPGGSRIESTDGTAQYVYTAAAAGQSLAASAPLAVASLALGALALVLLRARRSWVLPASALAFAAAGLPLGQSGNVGLATGDLAGAFLVPAFWVAWRLPGGMGKTIAVATAALGVAGWWIAARLGGWPGAADLESIVQALSLLGLLAIVADRAAAIRRGDPVVLTRPRPFDVAATALIAGAALVLVNLVGIPPVLIAVLAGVALLAIPRVRRGLRPLENALLADVRAQAAAEATEHERGRLARELHDVPLQELFGVIRRLEVKPGLEAESDDLRALASHLRNVAIDLRPPVLDDLGLPAALEYLAEGASSPGLAVRTQIGDGTGIARTQRPPEQVELAVFRIAMEAVTNAITHAGASTISITGDIDPRRVAISIEDNGRGLDQAEARSALKRKHMGLSSMRRRADAIDADFSIRATEEGTTVQVVWQA